MSERVMDPELLKNISIVTSSHNHTDHLDAETLIPVLKNNPHEVLAFGRRRRLGVVHRLHGTRQQ